VCTRRQVPERAFAFVRDQLWLARGIAPFLEDALTPEQWDVTTLAGETVSDRRLGRFAEGGRLCAADALRDGLLTAVRDVMTRENPATWLVPDPMAKPGDRFLARVDVAWFAAGDSVYYVERSPVLERLAATWKQANSAVGQLGLVTTHEVAQLPDLEGVANEAILIVVTAYDGDGVLLLERRSR
jgi:hypothetical protein